MIIDIINKSNGLTVQEIEYIADILIEGSKAWTIEKFTENMDHNGSISEDNGLRQLTIKTNSRTIVLTELPI